MSDTKDIALDLLDAIGEIVETLADGDGVADTRKEYMAEVRKQARRLWRARLKPLAEKAEDSDDIEDIRDLLQTVELLVRRFA